MSVSSVGSNNPFSYLQQLAQSDGVGGSASASSDPLQALFQSLSGGNSGDPLLSAIGQDDSSASSSGLQFSPDVMQALFSVQSDQGSASTPSSPSSLFGKVDTNGDGSISESEFESALGSVGADKSQADELFSKIDTNGDGSISTDELHSAMHKAHGGGHHHHAGGAGGSDPLESLLSSASADGTTSQSTTNPDGSTTTTLTYADGTTIDMTTPAAASGDSGSNGTSSNPNAPNFANLMKQLISMQAQLATPTTSLTV